MMNERQECCRKACRWTGSLQECKQVQVDSIQSDYVCPKCGGSEFYRLPEPIEHDRVNHANELIQLIANHGRKFFRQGKTIAHMEIDKQGKVWFVDDFSRCRVYTHYRGDWRGFSHGGTMRSLIINLRKYITKGQTLNPLILAPNCFHKDGSNIWGYEPSEAEKLRQAAWKLPMFPPIEEQLGE